MDATTAEFYFDKVKTFKSYAKLLETLSGEFNSLRNAIVQGENDWQSLERRVKAKEVELAEVEKQIKERRALVEKGARDIHDNLNKRHIELVEREAKVKILEKTAKEQLDKANALLAAAESKGRRKVEAAA